MDVRVIMEKEGGSIIKNSKDLDIVRGFQNFPILAMFGGNVEENTPTQRLVNQPYNDFWGNNLLLPSNPSMQFNSNTERTLILTPLSSSGISVIEDAIKQDLKFMTDIASIKVKVQVISFSEIIIGMMIGQEKVFYIWDTTNRELLDADFLRSTRLEADSIFDQYFDFSFE